MIQWTLCHRTFYNDRCVGTAGKINWQTRLCRIQYSVESETHVSNQFLIILKFIFVAHGTDVRPILCLCANICSCGRSLPATCSCRWRYQGFVVPLDWKGRKIRFYKLLQSGAGRDWRLEHGNVTCVMTYRWLLDTLRANNTALNLEAN